MNGAATLGKVWNCSIPVSLFAHVSALVSMSCTLLSRLKSLPAISPTLSPPPPSSPHPPTGSNSNQPDWRATVRHFSPISFLSLEDSGKWLTVASFPGPHQWESVTRLAGMDLFLSSQSHSSSIECAGFWPSWLRKETGCESSRETMPNARPGGTELMAESLVLR